jgi:hypothetical protein
MSLILPVPAVPGKRARRRAPLGRVTATVTLTCDARHPDGATPERYAMTNPENQSNWSDPTYQPPPAPADQWSAAAPAAPPESGYSYGDPSVYPTTTPSYSPAPYYGPPGYAPGQPYGQPTYVVSPPTNGLAIASMIVSLVGFGPVGAILGHVARKQIRERGEQGDGFALAGIIVGWVITAFWVLCCGFYAVGFGMLGLAGAGAGAGG